MIKSKDGWATIVRSCSGDSLDGAVRGAIDTAIGSALDIPFDIIGNPAERYIVDAVNTHPIGRIKDERGFEVGKMWYESVAVVRFPIKLKKQ